MLVMDTFLELLRSRALNNAPQWAKFYYTSSCLSHESWPFAGAGESPLEKGEEGDTTAVVSPSGGCRVKIRRLERTTPPPPLLRNRQALRLRPLKVSVSWRSVGDLELGRLNTLLEIAG